MGVQLADISRPREIEMSELAGKKVAIDAYNTIYQFLSIIRDRFTGEPLKDGSGRVTSHLSGLMYRFSNVLQAGIRPVMVFDGKPPAFKHATIQERKQVKEAAEKKWKEAVARGESGMKYAQATTRMTDDVLQSSKKLLELMGVPVLQAPSEGEAACAMLCRDGKVDYAASQDYDSLMFGSPRLVRNLSLSGRKKLPNKEVWVEVRPEAIELRDVLESAGISREQLITMGLLIGTDYNGGVRGVGPKTAMKLVKEHGSLDEVLKNVEWSDDVDPHMLMEWFMNPPAIEDPKMSWGRPQGDKIVEMLVEEHDFSRDRVEKIVDKLMEGREKGAQSSLGSWIKK